jgi:hypothetical protein
MHKLGFALALLVFGCGKEPAQDDGVGDDPGADAGVETPPAGYVRLIGRSWDIAVGDNIYRCVRATVPQNLYITSIVAKAPVGTHHSVLSIAGTNGTGGADGDVDCDAASIGMIMLYASGVGTSPLDFPAGVALEVRAGQQLHLNLHLANASDAPLRGETSIWVKAEPTPPPTLAEMVLAGPIDFEIEAKPDEQRISGECTASQPYTLFAVWPHMHRFAVHQKVELVRSDDVRVLHDRPFAFEEQSYAQLHPMSNVSAGDKVRVTCTYVNTAGEPVRYGDGPNSEMCFAGLYRYPAMGSNQYCPN